MKSCRQNITYTVRQIAEHIGAEVIGGDSDVINAFASLESAGPGCISYLNQKSYLGHLRQTSASAVILSREHLEQCPVTALVVDVPYVAYARAAQLLNPPAPIEPGVHPSAFVSPAANVSVSAEVGAMVVIEAGVVIGDHCYIGAGSVLKEGCRIGRHTRLRSSVVVERDCIIGKRCILHPGVVIGADGFGYANDKGRWVRIPQTGRTVIGDDVEIGANTCIDRGAVRDTVIGNGVIIDNLVQIGHNCVIGDHTAIAGNAGLSGSCTVGKYCMLGGGVGLSGHLELCDGVVVTGMSMVTHSIKQPGIYSSGLSAQDGGEWRKNHARLRNLDKTIRELKSEIRTLQEKSKEK
jgi:UDP-3-O-[3-hydroxymyristoyl] glucosamine N-acyltransferase